MQLCCCFQQCVSECRLIRLNSPNLNYLIIVGTSLLYCGGIGFVIPTLDPQSVPPICLVLIWHICCLCSSEMMCKHYN